MPRPRLHPAEVTTYRLLFTLDKYGDKLTEAERDAIGLIVAALDDIKDGVR